MAGFLQFFRHLDVVVEGIFVAGIVHDVAGVADAGFADLVLIEGLIDGDLHAFDPVQGVKDTEDVDTGLSRLLDKRSDDVVRIVFIANGIGAAEKHLEKDIRDLLTQDL